MEMGRRLGRPAGQACSSRHRGMGAGTSVVASAIVNAVASACADLGVAPRYEIIFPIHMLFIRIFAYLIELFIDK